MIEQVIIFGSRAKGNYRPGSGIELESLNYPKFSLFTP